MKELKIDKIEGFTPQIGHLVSQMNYVRKTTLEAVRDLTTYELDFLPSKDGNSIGALLYHMAAVEKGFQIEIFDGRSPNEQEMAEWGAPYSLGEKGREDIKGYSLEFYISKLEEVRSRTLQKFANLNDDWLYENRLWDNHPSNNYFIWFHVFEDEINHRGQIRMIRKMLSRNV
ncbi:DinB family protein [Radiobacillus kanasensis]|uniref:DinB family protein n=1 Tax=Radiobacillus kanasensis TaxID=2844358 RepID=UPI001E363FE3|nr:DinB family protein [Radiobacillus kanasensis]UFU00237.1 DinB family protein [Radiobacillus kanasensis]